MKPLITVIVPVYNVEKYVEKCVESIIQQTYSNLEILLIDDGSTDLSGKLCDEYTDSRVKVIHKTNGGQGSARNVGLDIAKGEYICFVDSDDSIKQDCIEHLYELLIEHKLDVSVCNIELYDENERFLKRRVNGEGYIELNGIEAIDSMWTQGVINIAPWAKLYKKELWEYIRFKECFSEDFATMHFIYEKAKKIGFSYECKLNYLVRHNSSIRAFYEKKLIMFEIARDNILFSNKYPVLLPAARQKAVSVYFHLLFQLPADNKYHLEKTRIKKSIKELRYTVLRDKRCIKKTRIALLLSYVGFDFTKKVFAYIKKRNVAF